MLLCFQLVSSPNQACIPLRRVQQVVEEFWNRWRKSFCRAYKAGKNEMTKEQILK